MNTAPASKSTVPQATQATQTTQAGVHDSHVHEACWASNATDAEGRCAPPEPGGIPAGPMASGRALGGVEHGSVGRAPLGDAEALAELNRQRAQELRGVVFGLN